MNDRDYPITPTPEDDPRFTAGLLHDVCDLLERHGYPRPAKAADLVDLQQALYRYLYVPREQP